MKRRQFLGIAGGTIAASAAGAYILSDKSNLTRPDLTSAAVGPEFLAPSEREILQLASLAPSGHNTQPWFVQYLEPFHWIIGNDTSKWLPAVDPTQRETMLSIGAFMQNLEYAAASFGYACIWNIVATANQDERVAEVRLTAAGANSRFDVEKIRSRRTVRSGFLSDPLKNEDVEHLRDQETDSIHYLPATAKETQYINEQTIEANRIQAYRDPAQQELADWIRFSSRDAAKYRDGLTTAGMEIAGISGFVVRNFYGKSEVMKPGFRETSVDKVRQQVSESAGWILITSKNSTVETLLETGRRMQRLFLNVREKSIAIHPMTQILEETVTKEALNRSIGISENIQFILRTGYLKNYPPPVSLRRPVEWFWRN